MATKASLQVRVLAVLFGLVFSALLLEPVVLVLSGEQAKFPRHVVGAPWGLRYNEPGADHRHKSGDGTSWFRINAQGMRADHDYAYEKQRPSNESYPSVTRSRFVTKPR